jgi:hypothetical protein
MARSDGVTLVAALGGGAYAGYGVFTDTGAVGWLNALQQRLFGSYQPMISFTVVLVVVFVAVTLVWDGAVRWLRPDSARGAAAPDAQGPPPPIASSGAGRSAPAVAATPARRPSQALAIAKISLVLLPLTWAVGGGVYWWLVREAKADAAARYQAVELTDGVALPALEGDHLALRGIPVTEAVVVKSSGSGSAKSEDYRLVPVVGVGWRPDRPVPFVVKVEAGEVLPSPAYPPDPKARHARDVVLFTKLAGAFPTAALTEFQKMRVPLAPEARLLRLVPTLEGKPVVPDRSGTRIATFGLCGLVSLMLLVMPIAGYREDRRRRAGPTRTP